MNPRDLERTKDQADGDWRGQRGVRKGRSSASSSSEEDSGSLS